MNRKPHQSHPFFGRQVWNQLRHRNLCFAMLSSLGALWIWLAAATPSQAHWADMAAAEIVVGQTDVQMTLTLPTGLVAFANGDQDGTLSIAEVQSHRAELQQFLDRQIYLSDRQNQRARLSVEPLDASVKLPSSAQIAPTSHSSLRLIYSWPAAIAGFTMHYGLFVPGVQTAHCLATILHQGQLQTFMFTPNRPTFTLTPGLSLGHGVSDLLGSGLWAIAGAFAWGAMHSLSPGHGKTLVGAYLMGERATPKHALFLAMTTTVTHTVGVFALGGVALFAAQYILPQQLYPWLSLLSGMLVVAIGLNLLLTRLRHKTAHQHESHHHHVEHPHSHNQQHGHHHSDLSRDRHRADHVHALATTQAQVASPVGSGPAPIQLTLPHPVPAHSHAAHSHAAHSHSHTAHSHAHATHSHLPPDLESTSWRSLLALGISGGIMPCPAALVLLLGAISLNQISLGLGLVLAFSLGLAGVLTALGLLMVYAKRLFVRIPAPSRFARTLPTLSAACITLIGIGVSAQAIMQMLGIST
jgi:nickel/cobalt transporter (NicO) family protein